MLSAFINAGYLVFSLLPIAFLVWRGWRFEFDPHKAHRHTASGGAFLLKEACNKYGSTVSVLLSVPVATTWRFCLRRQNWFDRLGKWLHLVREPELGHASFDELFYFEASSQEWFDFLNYNALARTDLIKLVTLSRAHGAKLYRVDCTNGLLSLHLNVAMVDEKPRFYARLVSQTLAPFAEQLDRLAPQTAQPKDTSGTKLLQISFVALISAVALLPFQIKFGESSLGDFLLPTALITALLLCVLIGIVAVVCQRSLSRHRTMLACAAMAWPAALMAALPLADLINRHGPQQPSFAVAADLIEGSDYRDKLVRARHPVSYRNLQLRASESQITKLYLLEKVQRPVGTSVRIRALQYPGALGVPWFELDERCCELVKEQ